MYICNCNGLNKRAIARALAEGASTPADVYRRLCCAPQCARCVPEVVELFRAARADAVEVSLDGATALA
ncbi:MAG: (2Fe-2S)-binding protein [Pseudomonadota bacterium]